MSDEVKEKPESKGKIPFLSEGILIAALTAVGYAVAYYYEKGYKGYFLVPEDYIELNPITIIKVIGSTFAVAIFSFIAINNFTILFRQVKKKHPIIGFKLSKFMRISLYMFFAISLQGLNLVGIIVLGIMMIIVAIYIFILPVLLHRKVRGYRQKLIASEDKRDDNGQYEMSIPYQVISKIGDRNYKIILSIIFVIALIPNASMIGEANATSQKVFMIVEGYPNYIMVGTYKDYAVVAEMDVKKKEVIPNYKLIKNEEFNAKLYEVGKLTVAKPEVMK